MPYMIAVSLEMSDEPILLNHCAIQFQYKNSFRNKAVIFL